MRGAHEEPQRHVALRRLRPEEAAVPRAHRDARRLALAQGARRERHHDREPRALRPGLARVRRRPRHLRHIQSLEAQADREVENRGQGRAPLFLRRPLRVHLAHRRGLHRQHHHDPRPQGSGAPRGSRALVDPGAVGRRRRALPVGELHRAALPSSAAPGQPALRELLAPRHLHPRHQRPVEAQARRRGRQEPGVSASDAHLPADAAEAARAAR